MMPKKDNSSKKQPKKDDKKSKAKRRHRHQLKDLITADLVHQDSLKQGIELLQEQLDCYILVGYGFNGMPVTAVIANTPQEYDALYQRVQMFLQQRPPTIMWTPPDPGDGEE